MVMVVGGVGGGEIEPCVCGLLLVFFVLVVTLTYVLGGRVRFSRCGPWCGERVDRSRWFCSESCALLWLFTTELQAARLSQREPDDCYTRETNPEAAGRFV